MLVHHFLGCSEGTERVEKALIDNYRYMWKDPATVSLQREIAPLFLIGQYFPRARVHLPALGSCTLLGHFSMYVELDRIPKSSGSICSPEFRHFNKHRGPRFAPEAKP